MTAMAVLIGSTLTLGLVGAADAAMSAAPPRTATSHAPVCPARALPLRPDGVQRAADTALAHAASLYRGLNTRGAEVMLSARSAFAGPRGGEVRSMCGPRVAARTVVVQMLFPRELPSASLSQAVVFVARFARGYRVWFIAH
jgi:hypothetical protein